MATNNAINQPTNSFCKTASNLSDVASIPAARANLGFVNGVVKFSYAAVNNLVTTSGGISAGDTIPQNNQGTQILSVTHTPSSATNILEIEVSLQVAGFVNISAQGTAALFQDAIANAIAAGGFDDGDTGSRIGPCVFKKIMVAGTTSAITFNVRAGSSDGSAIYINGQTGSRAYGGVASSTVTVKEYSA